MCPPSMRSLRVLVVAVLLAVAAAASPARADWLKGESDRFIVYSDGPEAQLRAFVQDLEAYDRLLRLRMGLALDEVPYRKLPIYLLRAQRDIRTIRPDADPAITGFYFASGDDIFAIATLSRAGDQRTLKHEYAHHFMLQYFPYPYPAWFIEGFADYYSTAVMERGRMMVGRYDQNRAAWVVHGEWMQLSDLMTLRPGRRIRNWETFYPLSWLLTHWFLSDPQRQTQLEAYLRDVGAGGESIEAMQRATGMTLSQLRRSLRAYRRLPYQAITHDFPVAAVRITRMPASADDLLLLEQSLKVGNDDDENAGALAAIRQAAARHPNDSFALGVLGRAELKHGDKAQGRALLNRLLTLDPANAPAMQLLAQDHLAQAREAEDLDQAIELRQQAQHLLAQAYALDDADFVTMMLLSELRYGGPGWPTENDLATLEIAFTLAPQLSQARGQLATALLALDRKEEAITILSPLANSPHGGEGAAQARAMINQARGVTEAEVEAEEQAARDRAGETDVD